MAVARAIEQLYDAFAQMPRPVCIKHASWELQVGEVKRLTTSPLRELSPALMRSYLSDAVYNVGTWNDFRYFLPRLIELSHVGGVELEEVSRRLKYAREHGFPQTPDQNRALHDFALVLWNDLLREDALKAERYLNWGTLESFGVTREELLTRWRSHAIGALAMARILMFNGSAPPEWTREEVLNWLRGAFFDEATSENQQVLSDVILMLEASSEP